MNKSAILACAVLLAGGCAATDPTSSTEPAPEKTYRTGSNIPTRDRAGVVTMSPEEFERQRDAAMANTGRKPGN